MKTLTIFLIILGLSGCNTYISYPNYLTHTMGEACSITDQVKQYQDIKSDYSNTYPFAGRKVDRCHYELSRGRDKFDNTSLSLVVIGEDRLYWNDITLKFTTPTPLTSSHHMRGFRIAAVHALSGLVDSTYKANRLSDQIFSRSFIDDVKNGRYAQGKDFVDESLRARITYVPNGLGFEIIMKIQRKSPVISE